MAIEPDKPGDSGERARALRIVYLGTAGAFSVPPLRALWDAGLDVRAVVLPALLDSAPPIARRTVSVATRSRRPALPLLTPFEADSIASLAIAREVPIFEVGRLADPQTLATLGALAPDAICVACFPRRLPSALLTLPRLGCLNVHPSLLPDNRGPDPLFWTFHRGDQETGVTVHLMDQGLDTGPILAQERMALAAGITERELERALATRGGALLVRALDALAAGAARPAPQDERRATAFGWPSQADYVITPDWPARRAYRFTRGVSGRAQSIVIHVEDASFAVRETLGYDEAEPLDVPWRLEGDVLALRCSPGVLRARVVALAG